MNGSIINSEVPTHNKLSCTESSRDITEYSNSDLTVLMFHVNSCDYVSVSINDLPGKNKNKNF